MFKVGDSVEVVRPDPDHGISCILAGYDAAYKVASVSDRGVYLETKIFCMTDPVYVGVEDIVKSDRKPWWEVI